DLDVLDRMILYSRDDRGKRGRVIAGDVADDHALEGANGYPDRAAHAPAQAQEQRAVRGAAQGDAGDRDVLAQRSINRLQRKAAALIEHAVGDGDVPEAPVGLGAALDPSGAALDGAGGDGLPGSIEHRAHLVVAG